MVREIPKDGKVWRLTKESWDALRNFDSDPNIAIQKIMKALAGKSAPPAAPAQHPGACKFEEKKLRDIVESAMEKVLKPFTGGQ